MKQAVTSWLLVGVMLLNLYCLGTGRIRALIQAAAAQGVLLGLMTLLVHEHLGLFPVLVALTAIGLKGLLIPLMLLRALRQLSILREIEPLLSLVSSLVVAAAGTALSVIFGRDLPLAGTDPNAQLAIAASLATVFSGFLLIITRLKAITQVVGYLVLENGVFLFGMLLIEAMPFFVEFGILLDLVVGIFVIVILLNHLSREFPPGGAERLSSLKEE